MARGLETHPTVKVTVYTKPVCQGCKFTKRKLEELDIEYTAVDLTADPEAMQRVRELEYTSAPVVEVDLGGGAFWHWAGYAPTQIEILDHALDCDNPECNRCESVIAA